MATSADRTTTSATAQVTPTSSPGNKVNLITLATSALASAIAASEPIQRIALEACAKTNDDDHAFHHLPSAERECSFSDLSTGLNEDAEADNTMATGDLPSFFEKTKSNSIRSRVKLDGTIVTDADGAAQKIIVDAIRSVSSEVIIVGEESKEEESRLSSIPSDLSKNASNDAYDTAVNDKKEESCDEEFSCFRGRKREKFKWLWEFATREIHSRRQLTQPHTATSVSSGEWNVEEEDFFVDPKRVSVFVDPLDGTKNYAHGKFDCVTILVAIVVDNTPCFGVICKPFGQKNFNEVPMPISEQPTTEQARCFAVYGGTLLDGVFIAGGEAIHQRSENKSSPQTREERPPACEEEQCNDHLDTNPCEAKAVISSSRIGGIVQSIITALHNQNLLSPDPELVSGAGEKSLRLILSTKGEALWPFPRPGTSLWDVAAADALLMAIGGTLTDKNGERLNYLSSNTDNDRGIMASSSLELHEACIRVFHQVEDASGS